CKRMSERISSCLGCGMCLRCAAKRQRMSAAERGGWTMSAAERGGVTEETSEISEDSSSGKKPSIPGYDWSSTQEFLSRNPEAVKSRNLTTGQITLFGATLAGNLKIVKELVHEMEKQAPKDEEFKYQPLFHAVLRDDWSSAQEILSQNSEAVKSRHQTTGHTALVVAALAGNLKIVQQLVHKMEKQPLIDGEFKYQPLFDAVLRDDWSSAQGFLSQNPEAVKSRHPTTGQTALSVATLAGNLKILKELVYEMEKQDEEFEYQPLFDAVLRDDLSSAQEFLSRNPEAVKSRHPTTGQTALSVATLAGNLKIVKELVYEMEKQDQESPDHEEDTTLI
ncbi:hypothetical protein UlMin_032485, partial [Ulmus minor]